MKLLKTAALLAFLMACAVTGVAQDKTTGAIKGRVRVEKGSPLGVAVALMQGEREMARTSSDKKGEFVLAHVTPGTYSVKFRKAGLATGTIDDVEVRANQTRSLGDRLVLAVDEGSIAFIRGSVFTETGRSVPGAKVELSRIVGENSTEKLDSRVTGETGEFVFRLPPDTAKYRLTLKVSGAESATKDVEVEGAVVYRVSLSFKPLPKN